MPAGKFTKQVRDQIDRMEDDDDERIEYTEKELAQLKEKAENGDADAALKLSDFYIQDDNPEWEKWCRMAADTGDSTAVDYYAEQTDDRNKRFELYSNLAKTATDPEDLGIAEYGVGHCYEKGEGVKKSVKTAFDWYLKAAEHGDFEGELKVGLFYKFGRAVEQDDAKAFYWLKKAADGEDMEAAFEVGLCYEKGRGVEADNEQAIRYYQMSLDLGLENARIPLERLQGQGGDKDTVGQKAKKKKILLFSVIVTVAAAVIWLAAYLLMPNSDIKKTMGRLGILVACGIALILLGLLQCLAPEIRQKHKDSHYGEDYHDFDD